MTSLLRKEVLKTFKNLHRARCVVFVEDNLALNAARRRINDEFIKNKHVTNVESIKELINYGNEVVNELRTTVVQIREKENGTYELRMRPEVKRLDNATLPGCQNTEKS